LAFRFGFESWGKGVGAIQGSGEWTAAQQEARQATRTALANHWIEQAIFVML